MNALTIDADLATSCPANLGHSSTGWSNTSLTKTNNPGHAEFLESQRHGGVIGCDTASAARARSSAAATKTGQLVTARVG